MLHTRAVALMSPLRHFHATQARRRPLHWRLQSASSPVLPTAASCGTGSGRMRVACAVVARTRCDRAASSVPWACHDAGEGLSASSHTGRLDYLTACFAHSIASSYRMTHIYSRLPAHTSVPSHRSKHRQTKLTMLVSPVHPSTR